MENKDVYVPRTDGELIDLPTHPPKTAAVERWNELLKQAEKTKLTRRELGIEMFKMAKLILGTALAASLGSIYGFEEYYKYVRLSEETHLKVDDEVAIEGRNYVVMTPLGLRSPLQETVDENGNRHVIATVARTYQGDLFFKKYDVDLLKKVGPQK